MALSNLRRWPNATGPQLWLTKDSSNPHFEKIGASQLIEENLPDYLAERYYPVRIGELLESRYQIKKAWFWRYLDCMAETSQAAVTFLWRFHHIS